MWKTSKDNTGERAEKVREFEALTFPLMQRLYNTALRMANGAQFDAEDLVQTTYMKAYLYFHRYKTGTNYSAWMFRILINNFINEYRNKKREPTPVDFETTCATFPENDRSELDKERILGLTEKYEDLFDDTITDALNNLPFEYRTVVLLRDINDLKYKEIAEVIGCPLGTVMSRLSRGRKMLADSLIDYANTNGFNRTPARNYVGGI